MKPYYWALLAALAWGCAPILEKLGLVKTPVFVGIFYRCLGVIIGAVILMIFKFDVFKESLAQVPHGWLYLVLGGLLASVVGQIFFYHALKEGEASLVVPLAAAYPLISFILGIFFLGEKVTWAKVAGLFFVLLGVVLLK